MIHTEFSLNDGKSGEIISIFYQSVPPNRYPSLHVLFGAVSHQAEELFVFLQHKSAHDQFTFSSSELTGEDMT